MSWICNGHANFESFSKFNAWIVCDQTNIKLSQSRALFQILKSGAKWNKKEKFKVCSTWNNLWTRFSLRYLLSCSLQDAAQKGFFTVSPKSWGILLTVKYFYYFHNAELCWFLPIFNTHVFYISAVFVSPSWSLCKLCFWCWRRYQC